MDLHGKSFTALADFAKAKQLFIGPKGGKWEDAEHKRHWEDTPERMGGLLEDRLKRRGSGQGQEVPLTTHELHWILNNSTYGLISAGKNPNLEPDMSEAEQKARHEKLRADLKLGGYQFTECEGHYGNKEPSFLVMAHGIPADELKALGTKYNQDSVVHVEKGKQNEMHYTTGDKKGQHHKGEGYEEKPDAEDYYTLVRHPDGTHTKFTLNFNFDKLHKAMLRVLGLDENSGQGQNELEVKAMTSFKDLNMFAKGGPYIGPKGGKWRDAAHTQPWGKDRPDFDNTTAEGQRRQFYEVGHGVDITKKPEKPSWYQEGEHGHDPVLDEKGNPTGKVKMVPTGRVVDLSGVKKSLSSMEDLSSFAKGGPYIGPRGGKWADPEHTQAWKEAGSPHGTETHITELRERAQHIKKDNPRKAEYLNALAAGIQINREAQRLNDTQEGRGKTYASKAPEGGSEQSKQGAEGPVVPKEKKEAEQAKPKTVAEFDKLQTNYQSAVSQNRSNRMAGRPLVPQPPKPIRPHGYQVHINGEYAHFHPSEDKDAAIEEARESIRKEGGSEADAKAAKITLVKKPRYYDKSLSSVDDLASFAKGGPYIGPRGGKWADPEHKIAWKEPGSKKGSKKEKGPAHNVHPVARLGGGKLGLHIIKNPNGTWGFTGSVPVELAFERRDGKAMDEAEKKHVLDMVNHSVSGAPLFRQTYASKVFKTEEEAKAAAKAYTDKADKQDKEQASRTPAAMVRGMHVSIDEMETDPDFVAGKPVKIASYIENIKAHASEIGGTDRKLAGELKDLADAMQGRRVDFMEPKEFKFYTDVFKETIRNVKKSMSQDDEAGEDLIKKKKGDKQGEDEKSLTGIDKLKAFAKGDDEAKEHPVGSKLHTAVAAFLKKHPNPEDAELHKWAESKGYDVHEVEDVAYTMATSQNQFAQSGRAKQKGVKEADVDKDQLAMGIQVELEHTKDKTMAKRIALDHLAEMPDYYTKLARMENTGKSLSKAMGTGDEQGGDLAGTGKAGGQYNSDAGEPIGAPKVPTKVLSEDDEKVEEQLEPGKKPIEGTARKSFDTSPQGQRNMVAREHAARVAQLQKGAEDVRVGVGIAPVSRQPEQPPVVRTWNQGPDSRVTYSDRADQAAAALVKSDAFYLNGSPSVALRPVLAEHIICPECQSHMNKSLCACPTCGAGTPIHRVAPGAYINASEMAKSERKTPFLRPAIERDLVLPEGFKPTEE